MHCCVQTETRYSKPPTFGISVAFEFRFCQFSNRIWFVGPLCSSVLSGHSLLCCSVLSLLSFNLHSVYFYSYWLLYSSSLIAISRNFVCFSLICQYLSVGPELCSVLFKVNSKKTLLKSWCGLTGASLHVSQHLI